MEAGADPVSDAAAYLARVARRLRASETTRGRADLACFAGCYD